MVTWHKHTQNKDASTQVEHQNVLASLQVDSVMLELSGRSFTMLHVSAKVTFHPLIWLVLTCWLLMNSRHLLDDTMKLRHMNSSASISTACLALRILLLRISNLGSARTLARYGDAPGNGKRCDRSVCCLLLVWCLTRLSWLSILTNLEYKSLFTFTSNKIKRKQMHTAYVRHVHHYFYQARTFRVTCERARKHEKTIKQHSISKWIHRKNAKHSSTAVMLSHDSLITSSYIQTVFQKNAATSGRKIPTTMPAKGQRCPEKSQEFSVSPEFPKLPQNQQLLQTPLCLLVISWSYQTLISFIVMGNKTYGL